MSSIVAPIHYQIYECKGTARWFVIESKAFYNGTDKPMNLARIAHEFGLTEQQVVINLFRINGGKPGYYLANLKAKKYYYCGPNWEDVRTTLQSLGIGRPDPTN
jgi:hypothetical protein